MTQSQRTKKPDSVPLITFTVGILCLLDFANGLGDLVTEGDSGSTFKLVLSALAMIVGGFGVTLAGWLLIRNRG